MRWLNLSSQAVETTPALPQTKIAPSSREGLLGFLFRETTPQSGQLLLAWVGEDAQFSRALRVDCAQRPDDWSLTPDGRYLALSYFPSSTAFVLDLLERKVVAKLTSPKWGGAVALPHAGEANVYGLGLSPDGRTLATSSGDRTLKVWVR